MGTVVVGLDGSRASRLSFSAALAEAELKGHDVRAVHVHAYPATTIYQATRFDVGELHEAAEKWLDRELAELEAAAGGSFPVRVEPMAVMGHAGAELVDAAEGADLLVVGSRGLGGVRGLLLGSVSTYCSHHLPCPLLIVPVADETDDG